MEHGGAVVGARLQVYVQGVGGNLAAAGDYIMLPLKSATNKYSLNLVYKDTKFRLSKMSDNANAWGVAMLMRNRIIGL